MTFDHILQIDLETYCEADLPRVGVYKYCEDPSFQILLFGFAVDDEEACVVDLVEDPLPRRLVSMLQDEHVLKTAYNAPFEITCLHAAGYKTPVEQWQDTAVLAAMCGLPRSLDGAAQALGLLEQKDKNGTALIRYFSKPMKPTKGNGFRTHHDPTDDPVKWALFKAYNAQDVNVERAIRRRLGRYAPDLTERACWLLDQRINQRGVLTDSVLTEQAIRISAEHSEKLMGEAARLTGLDNPNSVQQLKDWLALDGDATLRKADVEELLKSANGDRARVLEIRQELSRSSVKKYEAISRCACRDGRVRGTFRYYGAGTGRWSGQLVQLQNLARNSLEDLDDARALVREGDAESVDMLYGSTPEILSQLVRTAFIAPEGKTLCVADFSAIEARVTAWLAGERWRQEVFRKGGDIYCESASQMFHVPVVKHGVNGHLRQKGKIAELALGYGGGVGALEAMGGAEMGLSQDEMSSIVARWRLASPNVTRLWSDLESCALEAMYGEGQHIRLHHGVELWRADRMLHMRLPSGRVIRYWEPKVTRGMHGNEICYQMPGGSGMVTAKTWGGKLVENLVQATARDCLRESMLRVENEGKLPIVMHIHDEMVCEVDEAQAEAALAKMQELMSRPIHWAPGLLLRGDGYITKYYKKD